MPDFPADMDIWYRLAHDDFIMGSEPLGRWMQYFFFQLTGSRTWALILPSVLAGLIFAAGAWRVLKDMYPEEFAKAFAFVLLAPYSMFFLGYPSTCPLAYAFTGLYLLAGLDFIRSRPARAPWREALLLALAVWSHGMALWVTGAHLALVVIWLGRLPAGRSASRRFRASSRCVSYRFPSWRPRCSMPSGSVQDLNSVRGTATRTVDLVGLFVELGGDDASDGGSSWSWGLYSQGHLMGILSLTLRLAPAALVIPLVWRKGLEGTFLLAALLGGLLLVIVWNLDFGFYRDEKFALYGVPAHLYLLWRFAETPPVHLACRDGSAVALVCAFSLQPVVVVA